MISASSLLSSLLFLICCRLTWLHLSFHIDYDLLCPLRKGKFLLTYNFQRISKALAAPHITTQIKTMQSNKTLEGPGTELANPNIHLTVYYFNI